MKRWPRKSRNDLCHFCYTHTHTLTSDAGVRSIFHLVMRNPLEGNTFHNTPHERALAHITQ